MGQKIHPQPQSVGEKGHQKGPVPPARQTPLMKVSHQLLTDPVADIAQDAVEQGTPGGFQQALGNQGQQGRLPAADRQGRFAFEAGRTGYQPRIELQLKVLHTSKTLKLTVE